MPMVVSEVRLNSISLSRDEENGGFKVSGEYSLVGSTGKVMAKQSFNGYSGLKVEMSGDTHKALDGFVKAYSTDLNGVLGFDA